MTAYELDPIRDPRWREFLLRHPQASVFHAAAWLEALRDTYGYESVVLSTSGPGEALANGVVFCRVKSWLTGSRMVSLPFADHCQPLVDDPAQLTGLLSYAASRCRENRWKYVELRPMTRLEPSALPPPFAKSSSFCFHDLDLRPTTDELYRSFHKSCVQRKLQRAERENLRVEQGNTESLLTKLYSLLLLTRRRHQLPPQPLVWFSNLIRRFGEDLVIWIASKDTQPIAGILMLRFKNAVVYKYGCSDSNFHNLGGMPILFWRAIQDAKKRGAEVFDFGRSETENSGLITFKGHWGSTRSQLDYYRCARGSDAEGRQPLGMGLARKVFSSLPDFCLTAAGRLLYRHIG